jgi:CheY-like chemotaxis protein
MDAARPAEAVALELGVTKISVLGVDIEWIEEQAESAYDSKPGVDPPGRAELRAFALLSARLAPLVAHRRVLWVDDKPAGNVAEARLLRSLGVDVENALATAEALDRLRTDPARFDLVVSNWTREGREFVDAIRRAGHKLPTVFYVGRDTPERQAKAAALGAIGLTRAPDQLLKLVLIELSTAR